MSQLKSLPYFMGWFFQVRILGKRKPLQSVVFITDRCNLECKHCAIVREGRDSRSKPLTQILDELKYCYDKGSRIIDLQGGEPSMWTDSSDEAKALNDGETADINTLIRMAKQIGFFSTTVTTNAQMPIIAQSDLVWVSIDGAQEFHDGQRGEGAFERTMKNIRASDHPKLNANMCITNENWQDFEKVAQIVKDTPQLKKMAFSFYTPFEDTGLTPTPEQRSKVIDQAIALKKSGFPLMNSLPAIELMRDPQNYVNNSQCWISNFIMSDGTKLDTCRGEETDVCKECGFGMAAEMYLLWRLSPKMIKGALAARS
ncbi:MAG: radical SAM protein [Coriobacteriia bacterium]|nr:radical SAM protein [Coriobacteriia bacterium]MCL2746594.1 radical SAM protein [Coriobacteriia bacterium]MCL2870239.1 radical SAM protein [Coriobacteriia bacterium]